MFYSASNGGFYSREIHGDNIPTDAVEIGDEQYQALIQGQSEGKMIAPGSDGAPILVDQPLPSIEEVTASAHAMRSARLTEATNEIATLQDAEDLGIATVEEAALLMRWKQYRIAVSRVTTQEGFPRSIDWPEKPA